MNTDPDKPIREVRQDPIITICAMADPNRKRRGEATEAEFLARASSLEFRLARPSGDSDPYDALVGYGRGATRE